MKETIYTIPLNEAYEEDCECPLCLIKSRLEKEEIDYALGAAMMEPDWRIISNEKGYCNKHYSMLFANTNKLSLALVLDTHLNEFRNELNYITKKLPKKKSLFKKDILNFSKKFSGFLDKKESSCVVCDKISATMSRYIDILLDMWQDDEEFYEKLKRSNGVCMPHYKELIKAAEKKLSDKKAKEFIEILSELEIEALDRIQNDIHKFTLKFDYRNTNMEWGSAKDAPLRTIEKLSGDILKFDIK